MTRDQRWRRDALVWSFATSSCWGCAEAKPTPSPSDAAPEASPPFVEAGPLPTSPVICGDAACPAPAESAVFAEACCLPDGSCGLTAGLVSGACRGAQAPGSVDTTCPEHELPGGATLLGCCTPLGRCGLWDPGGGLGCIAPDDAAPPATSDADARSDADGTECRFDPSAECTELAVLPCDGPEDCSDGKTCCGRIQKGRLDRFECLTSCGGAARLPGIWLELCHVSAQCSEPGFTCSADPAHPFLARCYAGLPPGPEGDADVGQAGVRCGTVTCNETETCCLRSPREPYCSADGAACTCDGPLE